MGNVRGPNDRIEMVRTLFGGEYVVHGVEHECVSSLKKSVASPTTIELVKFQREILIGGWSLGLKRSKADWLTALVIT